MFEDDNNEVETLEETQEEELLVEEEDDSSEEDTVDWKAKALEEEARRKKAEEAIEKAKKKGKTVPAVQTNGLSTTDIIALTRANIADEDIDEVLDWANHKKISVAEALKSTVIKATLAERAEERTSAQAVHTGGGTRRANSVVSDDRLLADAQKGIMPESDADLARLTKLRILRK